MVFVITDYTTGSVYKRLIYSLFMLIHHSMVYKLMNKKHREIINVLLGKFHSIYHFSPFWSYHAATVLRTYSFAAHGSLSFHD